MTNRIIKTSTFGLIVIFVTFFLARINVDQEITNFATSNHSRLWVAVILLSSVIILFATVRASSKLGEIAYGKLKFIETEKRLKSLSPMEKYVLSQFINEKKAECSLDQSEAAVAWLESIKFISMTKQSKEGSKAYFRISPFVMKKLVENPNLLH